MVKSKLFTALQSLSRKEFIRFGQFVSSPFFNTNESLVKLYEYINRYYPEFNSPELHKEKVFMQIYRGTLYNDGNMRNLISDLYKLLETFLIEINSETDIQQNRNKLLYELHNRKMDKIFSGTLEKYERNLNDEKNINMSFFDNLRQLEVLKIEYNLLRGMQKNVCYNVLKRSEYNIYSFLLWLLFDLQDLKINEESFNAKYKYSLAKDIFSKINFFEILKTVKKTTPRYYLILKLYLLEGLAFVNIDKDDYYFEFKKSVLTSINKINHASKLNFFTSLINICFEKIFSGKSGFIKEEFALCREMVNRNILKPETDPYIDPVLIRNMALIAVQNKQIEWLNELLKNVSEKLSGDIRPHLFNLITAMIYFENRKYSESLETLSKVLDKGDLLKNAIYTLKLKLYYELFDAEGIKFTIDSFRHFLKNNKYISFRFQSLNSDFLKIYSRLLKLKKNIYENNSSANRKNQNIYYEISKVNKTVNTRPYFKEKDWIIDKLSELEIKLNE
jgi:hypothetical protein